MAESAGSPGSDSAPPGGAGVVLAVCLGPGGIPKAPVASARVGLLGLEGDAHRYRGHGGPKRALCLLGAEEVEALRQDGVPVEGPGAFGENLLTRGLDCARLRPGERLLVGDEREGVLLELEDVREPCATLRALDARFPDLMLGRSGWLCSVLSGGILRPGMPIRRHAGLPSC